MLTIVKTIRQLVDNLISKTHIARPTKVVGTELNIDQDLNQIFSTFN